MKRIYFDNAATTPLAAGVMEAMLPYMINKFGNPSSQYSYGREAKLAIETARKKSAQLLGAQANEIYFTSGGTESNNTAIAAAIRDLHCTHIITSPTEHHSVLHPVEYYARKEKISYSTVNLLPDGHIDFEDLEIKLKLHKGKSLVSLMHANNESGNITDIERAGGICKKYAAVFHSDCVQTVGHYPLDLSKLPADFISASAHKFHGPKGAGILYVDKSIPVKPLLYGGAQERNIRAGTENVYGIVGFSKALELAMENYSEDRVHVHSLKLELIDQLNKNIQNVSYNGDISDNSLYTVLSVSFPRSVQAESLLFELDQRNICVSAGSACASGSGGSHVINAISAGSTRVSIRFSFSKLNNSEEIQQAVACLKEILKK